MFILIFFFSLLLENLTGLKKDEDRIRRAAEREGRRIRRMKSRSVVAATSHLDGMSSDDEITEMAATSYRNQRGESRVLLM